MKKLNLWALPLLCLCLFGCKEKGLTEQEATQMLSVKSTQNVLSNPDFAVGVDLSSVPKDVAKGAVYYDRNGVATECHQLFRNLGANAIRIRVWVNHVKGYSSKESVVAQAILAKSLGYKIMIDFHYSDTWADAGPTPHQTKPAAWASFTLAQLKDAVYNHTYDVMDSLKDNGIYPEWVQVGNETNNGMLWDTGKASLSMSNYAALTNKGYDAVKAVSPNTKVIVHVAGGDNLGGLQFIYGGLNTTGGKYDIIGVSLYPSSSSTWQTTNNQCFSNLKSLAATYNKEVMVVEIGMNWQDSVRCRAYVADIINKMRHIPNGKGLGVFYWAPESYFPVTEYKNGMMNLSGRPTIATEAFQDSVNMNYILNPDFDENGATHNPTSWLCTNGTANTNGSYTQMGGHNGTYKLSHWKNVNYHVKTYQVASNIPNGNYTLKAWVSSSGGQDTCQLIAKEYGAAGVQKVYNITATSSWKQIHIPNIQVTNNSCKVVFYSKAPANKWLNMDGVQLLKQ
ncbi:glycoside hydrolase family 53 protein [Desertivirga xinjiangensis]|uniref:glycoside hydrolase family 53 protein n=1 Tax=Desertivirga xinjiangensis TaxID=539206 RepID=UPI002109AA1A|nr:glycosyl hydrolase 53 family protein [Pedobacter xinjiangensis]